MLPAMAVTAAGAAAQNAHANAEPLSARLFAAARVAPTAVRCATSDGTPVCFGYELSGYECGGERKMIIMKRINRKKE